MKSKGSGNLLRTDGDDDCMTGIITTRTSRADVDVGREDIDEFTFAFVTPLSAEDDSDCICGFRTGRTIK